MLKLEVLQTQHLANLVSPAFSFTSRLYAGVIEAESLSLGMDTHSLHVY